MIPQHTPAPPVVLSVAEWNTIVQALGYLPGMVAQPIVAAVMAQTQPKPKEGAA